MRAALRDQIDQGKTHDEIIQAFIGIYGGQHFWVHRSTRGFNRLRGSFRISWQARRRGSGFAACASRGACVGRQNPRPPPILTSSIASTMSSATSTRRGPAETGRIRQIPCNPGSFRPRGARLRNGRHVRRTRPGSHCGHPAERLMGAAGLVGIAALRALRPWFLRRRSHAMVGSDACRARTREEPPSAPSKTRVRQGDGQAFREDWQEMSARLACGQRD
jgi:hypothetical protein